MLPPMGWYPDPGGSEKERYWDGSRWTRNLRAPREIETVADQHDRRPGSLRQTANPLPTGDAGARHQVVQRRSADAPRAAPASRHPEQQPDSRRTVEARTGDGMPLAGWWWRVLSTIIDAALVWIVVAVVLRDQFTLFLTRSMQLSAESMNSYGAMYEAVARDQELVSASTAIVSGAIIGQALYQFIMLVICSASIGQLICRLRVVEADHGQEHRRLRWGRALLRSAVWGAVEYVSQTTLGFLGLFSYLMPLWQRRRQTIHDIVGGTQVIRLPRD